MTSVTIQPRPPLSPQEFMARLSRVIVLYSALIGVDKVLPVFFDFKVRPRLGACTGFYNTFYGYGWCFVSTAEGLLVYGDSSAHDSDMAHRVKLERVARRRLVKLTETSRHVPPMHPYSCGLTFCLWARGHKAPWKDLTGADPECTGFSLNRAAIPYISNDSDELWAWAIESYRSEAEGRKRAVLAVLDGKELTPKLLESLATKCTAEQAQNAAQTCYYPTGLWRTL